ncbi:MAG: hypothetical protein GYA71_03330, partial [Bacteroidales bacterium]|nr:hypothetical protein [Bacteroidales bacterium]
MKRIIVIIASLIIIVAIGYAVFYIFSQGAPASPANPVRVKPVDLSGSENISEWREENRTGNSAETGLLKSWPDAGPELIWSNLDLPKGNSSVSFGNNTIYLTGNDNVNDILVALDEYGKIKWKTPYGRIWKGSHPESRCTPTVE